MPPEDTTATETSTATTETKPPETAAATATDAAAETADGSLMGDAGTKQAGDKPAEETNAAGAEGEGDKDAADHVVPETYELTMPEGFTVDPGLMEEATPIFKDLKLSNEQANKLVPMAAKLSETLAKQQNDSFQAMASDWAREAQKDPEIGGAKWAETEGYVAKALDTFGAPKDSPFRKLLDESKLGNHPEMIRMFRKIGERVSEDDNFVRPDAGAAIKASREDILYGASETK